MGADAQGEIARALALQVLGEVAIGDRVVVRALHGDGASDALGELVARTPDTVTIDTRRGLVAIDLSDVVAAKRVPPPPTPRSRPR